MPKMICSNNDDTEVASKDECEEAKETMKKGPWTAAEDAMLREYVMKYGEGNWNSVQKNSGFSRCGKSCRLRWANHLRPNLKKGAFSKEEEQIIIHLHAKLGNKWARMAAQLPGRTDNEIKNFWNTRKKRCQRAGLPLYPPEVQNEANTYHLQQKQYLAQPQPSSSVSFSPFLSPSYRQELNELSNSSAANPQQNQPNSSCYTNSFPQFKFPNEKNGNSNMGSPYRSSPSSLFNHNFAANDSHDYHFGSYSYGFDNSAVMAGSSYESLPLVQGSNTEVSSQSSPHGSMTSALSYASGVYGLAGASSMANGYYEVAPLSPQGNSGLSTTATKLSYKRKSMAAEEYVEEEDIVLVESSAIKNSANTTNKTQRVDSNSSQFSTGNKLIAEDTLAGMNCMDDDLFSLLNNFPSEIPVLDWYHKGERQPLGLETQQDASVGPTDQEFAWTLGTFWSNMPNMC